MPDDVLLAAGEAPRPTGAPAPAAAAPVAAAPAAPATKKEAAAAPAPAPAGSVPMNAMQKAVVKNMDWANSVPTYQVCTSERLAIILTPALTPTPTLTSTA